MAERKKYSSGGTGCGRKRVGREQARREENGEASSGGQTSAELRGGNYAALAQLLLRAASGEVSETAAASKAGRLHLVATPIGHRGDITLRALLTLAQADLILCEDTRVSGALLRSYGISRPLLSYHEHNAASREAEMVARLQAGAQLALVSDAGMPLIADPGFRLVRACQTAGIEVTVCPGPSALLTALTLSGLPPQPFLFGGFLPPRAMARRQALEAWQAVHATIVFYETPRRLLESLRDMLQTLGNRQAAVARELTKLHEECRPGFLSELIAHYAAHPPKGEIVVLLAPPEDMAVGDDVLQARLRDALSRQSLRDAVAEVADLSGAPRDKVYRLALQMKQA